MKQENAKKTQIVNLDGDKFEVRVPRKLTAEEIERQAEAAEKFLQRRAALHRVMGY